MVLRPGPSAADRLTEIASVIPLRQYGGRQNGWRSSCAVPADRTVFPGPTRRLPVAGSDEASKLGSDRRYGTSGTAA